MTFDISDPTLVGRRAKALRRITEEIVSGGLVPDVQYSEQQIAGMLQMSRTPVREALGILSLWGFVRQEPQVGLWVLPVTRTEADTLTRLRGSVEAQVAQELASRVAQDHDLSILVDAQAYATNMLRWAREQQDSVGEKVKAKIRNEFAVADTDFHVELARAAGFDAAIVSIGMWSDRVRLYRRSAPLSQGEMAAASLEHQGILDAIRTGDPNQAANAVIAHFDSSRRRLGRDDDMIGSDSGKEAASTVS